MKLNIKKLDEVDVVFVDTPWTKEDKMALSEYIKMSKQKASQKTVASKAK